VRHVHIDVDTVALRAGHVHLLHEDRRSAALRIHEILRAVALDIAENGPPERDHVRPHEGVDRHLYGLYRRRVGRQSLMARDGRYLAGEFDVALAQSAEVGAQREQPNGHPVGAQVHVGLVVDEIGQLTDRLREPRPDRERAGPEARTDALPDDAPVLDAVGRVEPTRGDPLGHVRDYRPAGRTPQLHISTVDGAAVHVGRE
jgi:hypothetical protein